MTALRSFSTAFVILLLAGICLTQECKRMPKKKNPNDCGEYYLCLLGQPTQMHCSVGLAYNKQKGICDWADLVEDCDVEKFLEFECPDASAYEAPGTNQAFAHPTDCAKQLVCVQSSFGDYKKVPRLLSCDYPQVFNPEIGKCDYYKEVKGCETYYEELKRKVSPVKAASEIEAGAIPDERVVPRHPTSRPGPETRRTATNRTPVLRRTLTAAPSARPVTAATTTASTSATTTRKPTTGQPTQDNNEDEGDYDYEDEEQQKD
ncbi:putative chitinase 3-like [Tropilaelaps mercedesae]|uniref:Putative chitinase 3-like n=1 Tax=Tropilaelaps mercedesae TaxID=418985 RepID=A0A1V9Y2Q7_9ACAR|nr:putative chitinase 3-like [Tropilaelaps mercedesae]